MDRVGNKAPAKGVDLLTVKNVILLVLGVTAFILIYKFMRHRKRVSEFKRNSEIDKKMKMSREKRLQELEKEMMANKQKMSEQVNKGDDKKDKALDSDKPKPDSKNNSSFSHFRDLSNYYRPSIRNRLREKL
ncbi:hypothetical protein PVIIG_01355 [Plasmodium vivax India VII]|uniref:Selenoprotein n=5 Tax=Plasmodium vivax TaxID=5855 RepID=A5K0X7_PLAVS|nr:hypothetical protein, conserved [Plasmodium vivax]KMZ78578.1 hypothetical protein PVIIG_01355 [Plasmodium vivax India VII]KMZ83765.1 hypothetical protein PVBG_00845 [Plasmodium vivax Brazil I]KMZ90967.1 hypothetical protein PVMG_04156 [Plasmodium vivax Mauritania I]KMZ97510.1 hypothetical protein PVNG_03944 [Plasmodium vivax North Korean]EDL46974.1 hypothetical protein, conserved [Plasmodium vivax]|eukprot:XP_001616701.1 hypothetical protein [Plasmodium vivax Sal-1]